MRRLTLLIAATLLTTLLASCLSPKVEYIDRLYVPPLAFPIFPEAEWAERNKEARSVTVPEEWFVNVARFKILYEELEKNYNGIKELEGSKEKI